MGCSASSKAAHPRCTDGHFWAKMSNDTRLIQNEKKYANGLTCEVCKKTSKGESYHCAKCEFDCCLDC